MITDRTKIIKRIGDSAGIILNSEERKILDVTIGDVVTITVTKGGSANVT